MPALLTKETRIEADGGRIHSYRTRREIRQRQEKEAVKGWDAVEQFAHFVVLGAPGIGKTTYLYHLASGCAQRQHLSNHLPIFLRLRYWSESLTTLEYLEDIFPTIFDKYNFPNAKPFIQQQLKRGRCLVLLDGLDEVSDKNQYNTIIKLVQEFDRRYIEEDKPGNIIVVSSRKHSYEHGQQLNSFRKTEVIEFNDERVERFIYKWFTAPALVDDAPYRRDDSDLAAELVKALHKNDRFMELARNPLLLLLIVHHYRHERSLPDLRADLYRRCIQTRIASWNDQRGTHRGRFGEGAKYDMLSRLALDSFQHEQEGLWWRQDLVKWLQKFIQEPTSPLPKETQPEKLLDEVVQTSGLLYEWAIDRYGFSHRSLQEYFAADAVSEEGPKEGAKLLANHLEKPVWKEVILLYSGKSRNVQPLLDHIVARAEMPEKAAAMWLLAGSCLAEGARGVNEETRVRVTEALVGLLSTHALHPLKEDERERAVEDLRLFAANLLAEYVTGLLVSGVNDDLYLAQRLLPAQKAPELKAEIDARLAELARSGDVEEKQAAAAALGRMGAVSKSAVQALLNNLANPDPAARAEACRALGSSQVEDDAVAEALLDVYNNDAQDEPRHAALEALLLLGREKELEMVLIPAGEFLMGSTQQDQAANDHEKPQHKLYLPAYVIDRTPVTNAQYGRFMAAGGYANSAYWPEAQAAGRWKGGKYIDYYRDNKPFDEPRYWDDEKWNKPEYPVVGVSWYEALAYARWAGKRLPTEAEWEKAARGTDGLIYPWGDTWQKDFANTEESGHKQTTPVEQYAEQGKSPFGVVDMAGNVWEWCSTRWRDERKQVYTYPYSPDDGREDLSGGDDVWRVL
ncbi:MAG: SUMF1/EgtB/PvdO family nonheme iron enzyme, partial [Anaerolineales bacterium]|nr:SUMF1/EgtB/PvdO family nonheme iron enzyme [Anaerolineales bacterium]